MLPKLLPIRFLSMPGVDKVAIVDLKRAVLDLFPKVAAAWSADTASAGWSPENPALNQCAVTALVVQDLVGGELVRSRVDDDNGLSVSHYFNRHSAADIDLTWSQFDDSGSPMRITEQPVPAGFSSARDYVLSFPATLDRYKVLRARMCSSHIG